ncbi:MAG: hypothetical protein GY953_33470 [bacterium]|nr:hypothetical protein [bacterium]
MKQPNQPDKDRQSKKQLKAGNTHKGARPARPKPGRAQRDPLDYDQHPYPSMKRFAEVLAHRYDAIRTRHSYYRDLRLIQEHVDSDPATVTEDQFRDYILHVKTKKKWKPKTIRQTAASAKLFFVEMLGHEDWTVFSQIRTKDHDELPVVITREEVISLLRHVRLRRYRTPVIGGHLYGCKKCRTREFVCHSCNHRCCPQCGRAATAEWVQREMHKRIGAPYFMVTFTLPAELRPLFFGPRAKETYDLFFSASASVLRDKLAARKWLGAHQSGFTGILHTWTQRLLFHPHIHYLVPGAGLDAGGRIVTVRNANFLVPVSALSRAFREHFLELLEAAGLSFDPAANDEEKDWGVDVRSFGTGESAIKYLGAYVCRTAIGDSRILSITEHEVTFRWKDRQNGERLRTETVSGVEFVARYLRHVLPRGLRAIRRYGFCHPAAKVTRERVAFHTGRPLLAGAAETPTADTGKSTAPTCPCCQQPMTFLRGVAPLRILPRGPPCARQLPCAS